ncbi:MAG: hypothetical protein A3H31_03280 [Gallionellales bacterium RIFCSPLOWO2_02_FULL_57_47]|nr:MAG: hypothetical protein A3H31_03280 [Gallionellales bacterium RIFCSPLOWO2_02_FULL_57_47]
MKMESWYDMLQAAMKADGENFDKRTCTLDETSLRKEFDVGYGLPKGEFFTAWGEKWVYFPLCYDGLEWVGHAPRNPCDIAMAHQGR